MPSINRKVAATAAMGVAAVAIGMGVSSAARAADTSPTPTSTTQSGSAGGSTPDQGSGGQGKGWGGRHGFGMGADLSQLATKLGISESKLRDAFRAIRPTLKDDLKSLRASAKSGAATDRAALRDQMLQKVADALGKQLGIDSAKVKTALQQIEASREAELKQRFSDRLDQAVKDGKLTQSEADAVKKAAAAGVIPYRGLGAGMGAGMGAGRGMGMGLGRG